MLNVEHILEGKRYYNNFQSHVFLRTLNIAPFSFLLRNSGGKPAIFRNSVNKRGFENFSNIFFPPVHSGPEWNRFVQKTKKVKVVQVCKTLTFFISSIQGSSKTVVFRTIIIIRKALFVNEYRWHSPFLQKSPSLLSNCFDILRARPH